MQVRGVEDELTLQTYQGKVAYVDLGSAPWPVPKGVVSSLCHPSWLLRAGSWESAISYCDLAPNKLFLLHNSPSHFQFSPRASKPQVTFSS